jgi:gliding motility-associated-like protein
MNRVVSILFILISLTINAQKNIVQKFPQQPINSNSFIENKGQWDKDVLFKSSFRGGNIWFQKKKILFHLKDYQKLHRNHANESPCNDCIDRQHVVHVNFLGANEITILEKGLPSEEYYNYFIGNDSTKWGRNARAYNTFKLLNIYEGIDLNVLQNDEEIKYEFHVLPGVDPKTIKLGISGSKNISVNEKGQLVIQTPLGNITEDKPFVYQEINGVKKEIRSTYRIQDSLVTFQLGIYNSTLPLIIDPVLIFATYSGSKTDNFGMTATYSNDGAAYSGGTIFGNSYPTPDSLAFNVQSNFTVQSGGSLASDVFISKYSADGSKMIWTNFLGGGNNTIGAETVHSLICDSMNNVYGFGATSSTDFPTTTNCYQSLHQGGENLIVGNNGANFGTQGTDIFVFKLSASGKDLKGSTYVGGNGNDGVNYNYTGQLLNYYNQDNINYNGAYYTFIPYDSLTSNYGDQFRGEIILDKNENIYIASSTHSGNFPVKNAFQPNLNGKQDGIILSLKKDFSNILFSSYIGGTENDALYSLKIDQNKELLFCGGTSSSNLNTSSDAYQKTYQGGKADGFIGKLNPTSALTHLSYIGTKNFDQTFLLDTDERNFVYVVGNSLNGEFPVINSNYFNPKGSQFIAFLDSNLTNIVSSTIYGSGKPNIIDVSPCAFMVDACHNVYVSGWGSNVIQNGSNYITGELFFVNNALNVKNIVIHPGSLLSNMPVSTDAFQKTPPDGFDFHLFAIDQSFSNLIYGSYFGGSQSQEHVDGGTSRFNKNGVIYQSICGGCGGHSDFPTSPGVWSNKNLSTNCNNIVMKFDFQLLNVPEITSNQDSICEKGTITFENTSNPKYPFYWKFNDQTTDSIHESITKEFLTPGEYEVDLYMKNPLCYSYTKTEKKITVLKNNITAQADASIHKTLKNTTVKLFGNPEGYKYLWEPGQGIKDVYLKTTDAIVDKSTIYTLTVSDGICNATDTTYIETIDWKCDFPYVFVPNAFSPNNDNVNDILYVRGHPISSIEFRVFNRWGEKVFESSDVNNGWDGTYKGKLLDPDVYDYYLLVECSGGLKNQLNGNITLVR